MSPVLDATDYYKLCQDGTMDILRALPDFSAAPMQQVSTNRNNINRGRDNWAVFYPGTFTSSKPDPHSRTFVWNIVFELYVRYKTAEEAPDKFTLVRSSIINALDVYPTLNGVLGVRAVNIAARGDLLQDTPGDSPNFLIQQMVVQVTQRIALRF